MSGGRQPDDFDIAAHQRERIRALELANGHLEKSRAQLERLLASALRIAAGSECDPLILLALLIEVDTNYQETERLAQLLRDTYPKRMRAAA